MGPSRAPKPSLVEQLGHSADARLLILHADDLGVAHSVNAASIRALENGSVSSASVMVPCPWFPEIAAYLREHPEHDVGIHLTLTSEWKHYRWRPLLPPAAVSSLLDERGYLPATSEAFAARADPSEAEAEMRAQLERALEFGIRPTHLDTHMGSVFLSAELFDAYLRLGRQQRLPVFLPRGLLDWAPSLAPRVAAGDLALDGAAMIPGDHPEDDLEAFYVRTLEQLPPGVTQLIVHLAFDDAEMRAISVDHPAHGASWRQRDYDFFSGERARELLARHDIRLITWRELGALVGR